MSEFINEIAQIELPKDLLQQVNLPALVKKFQDNHNKLDDFKKAHKEHNNRGGLKKVLDMVSFDDTLENAHLNAVETQAEYAKSIGQLLVFSIHQSQYLVRQQSQLSEQQDSIKVQTTSIEQHSGALADQHKDLAAQTIKLREVIDDFTALKGFTQAEIKKFFDIAHKVEGTEARLLQGMDALLSDIFSRVDAIDDHIQANLDDAIRLVNSTILDTQAKIDSKFSAQLIEVNELLASLTETLHLDSVRINQLEENLSVNDRILTSISAKLESEHSIVLRLDQRLDAMSEKFAMDQSKTQDRFRHLHVALGMSLTFSVGLLGFIIAYF